MSKNSNLTKLTYKGFDGIDVRKCKSGEKNLYDVKDFRISEEGALVKRQGFQPIISTMGFVSGVWSGTLEGSYVCFYLEGNEVYRLDMSSGAATYVGSVSYSSYTPGFFRYGDSLYIFTSSGFFKVTGSSVTSVLGYVALYGKDWGTTLPGEINEPLNLLNGYGRISYTVKEPFSSMLSAGRPIKSVVSVYKNGVALNTDDYIIDPNYNAISVPSISAGDKIIATYCYDVDEERNELFRNKSVEVFGGISQSRIFLWGGTNKSDMLASRAVSAEALDEAEALFPNCSSIYFPEGCDFTVGDGKYPISGLIRHYDRLLIFTENDTWIADSAECQSESIPIMNVNSSVGCSVLNGVSRAGNDPVTVWKNGIYRWTSETDELNECNAYSISEGLDKNLVSDLFKSCIVFKDIGRNEIWFYSRSNEPNAWIYNVSKNAWTRFSLISGICGFFDANGEVGFFTEQTIYKFGYRYVDTDSSLTQTPVNASISIYNVSFGTNDKKRLSQLAMKSHSNGGTVRAIFSPDVGRSVSSSVLHEYGFTQTRKRLTLGRFSFLKQIYLEATGDETTPCSIYELEISAK